MAKNGDVSLKTSTSGSSYEPNKQLRGKTIERIGQQKDYNYFYAELSVIAIKLDIILRIFVKAVILNHETKSARKEFLKDRHTQSSALQLKTVEQLLFVIFTARIIKKVISEIMFVLTRTFKMLDLDRGIRLHPSIDSSLAAVCSASEVSK